MALKEPRKSQDKDPWGGRRKTQGGPPDLDELIRKLQQKLNALFGGMGKGTGGGTGDNKTPSGKTEIVLAGVIAWLAYETNNKKQPAERGKKLRFGKYVDTLQPGPS